MCICDLPVMLFTCTSNLEGQHGLYVDGAKNLTFTAHILAGIGAATLLAGAGLVGLIVAGVTFALSFYLLLGVLAVAAVAFSLSYVASASATHALNKLGQYW